MADSFDDKSALDMVYNERNRCVAAMCSMAQRLGWSAWLGKHEPVGDPNWDPEWLNVVYINLPTGSVSWHLHDRDLPLFAHVPRIDKGAGTWDGHTTDQKYKRLEQITYGVQASKHCVSCGVAIPLEPGHEHMRGCQRP